MRIYFWSHLIVWTKESWVQDIRNPGSFQLAFPPCLGYCHLYIVKTWLIISPTFFASRKEVKSPQFKNIACKSQILFFSHHNVISDASLTARGSGINLPSSSSSSSYYYYYYYYLIFWEAMYLMWSHFYRRRELFWESNQCLFTRSITSAIYTSAITFQTLYNSNTFTHCPHKKNLPLSIMLSEISQVVRDKYHMISPLTGT